MSLSGSIHVVWLLGAVGIAASRIVWRLESVVNDDGPTAPSISLRIFWRKDNEAESPIYTKSYSEFGAE